jgi:hypothetical protein
VARGGHQEQDHESGKPQLLKGEIAEAREILIGYEEADQGVFVAETMELNDAKRSMNESEEKCHDTEVAAIIKQREKTRVEPAQGADTQHHVQKKKCGGTDTAND